MEQRLSLITLVDDPARARRFYEDGLGWTAHTALDGVCFYQLPGLGLALFGWQDLTEDARRPVDGRFRGITLAINGLSREDVDRTLAQAEFAGATITKPAQEVFWGGYSGYFADPNGRLWEVAHNPACTIHAGGPTTF